MQMRRTLGLPDPSQAKSLSDLKALLAQQKTLLEKMYRTIHNDMVWITRLRQHLEGQPGYLHCTTLNGTSYYLFIEDDGTLKIHTAVPTANADGSEVGTQT